MDDETLNGHLQAKTCQSGCIYNYLYRDFKDIYEFDLMLNSEMVFSYSYRKLKEGNNPFKALLRQAVNYEMNICGISRDYKKFESEETARAFLYDMVDKNVPIVLILNASVLTYHRAFRNSLSVGHSACIRGYKDGLLYIEDTYLSNSPLASYSGWVDEEQIFNSWQLKGYSCYTIDLSQMDDKSVVENRKRNIDGFFERYLSEGDDGMRKKGLAAEKALFQHLFEVVENGDKESIQKEFIYINFVCRAEAIIGIKQLIVDYIDYIYEKTHDCIFSSFKDRMNKIINTWEKVFFYGMKQAIRGNVEGVLNCGREVCESIDEERLLIEDLRRGMAI